VTVKSCAIGIPGCESNFPSFALLSTDPHEIWNIKVDRDILQTIKKKFPNWFPKKTKYNLNMDHREGAQARRRIFIFDRSYISVSVFTISTIKFEGHA
jgi:hypothetical protein